MISKEVSWSNGTCKTWDNKDHNYSATERHSMAGVTFIVAFEEFGSFSAYSEEEAIFLFEEWYKKNVKAPEDDLRNEIRQPLIRNRDTVVG